MAADRDCGLGRCQRVSPPAPVGRASHTSLAQRWGPERRLYASKEGDERMKIIIGREGQSGHQTITLRPPTRILETMPVTIVLEHEDEQAEIKIGEQTVFTSRKALR